MMLITVKLLKSKGACAEQVDIFAALFPDGVEPTEALAGCSGDAMDGETEWRTRPFDPTPEQWRELHADQRCGPRYPQLPSVEKWRRLNQGRDLTPGEISRYGQAVLTAIHNLNAIRPHPELDLRCTAWKRNRAAEKLAKLADAACAARIAKGNVEPTRAQRQAAFEAAVMTKEQRLARLKMQLRERQAS